MATINTEELVKEIGELKKQKESLIEKRNKMEEKLKQSEELRKRILHPLRTSRKSHPGGKKGYSRGTGFSAVHIVPSEV